MKWKALRAAESLRAVPGATAGLMARCPRAVVEDDMA